MSAANLFANLPKRDCMACKRQTLGFGVPPRDPVPLDICRLCGTKADSPESLAAMQKFSTELDAMCAQYE